MEKHGRRQNDYKRRYPPIDKKNNGGGFEKNEKIIIIVILKQLNMNFLDIFKKTINNVIEESIDYSNGNNWYYNTNENGYCRLYLNTSLGNAINRIVEARYYEMSRR